MTWTAAFTMSYDRADDEREGASDFENVAREFLGDMQDPAAGWIVSVTNDATGETRGIDTETWSEVPS